MPAEGPASRRRLRTAALLAATAALVLVGGRGVARAAITCASAPAAENVQVQLTVDGRRRMTLVHVPAGIPAGRQVGLVLALHGVGGSGPQMQRYSGLSAAADRSGFIVAYPSSAGSFWNSTGSAKLPDDVHFIDRLISELERIECVNPMRVYVTGVSNGGEMAALAACELSARIAAIAPVAGGYDGLAACRPARPVAVLDIHGTADPVVPYFGPGRRPTASGVPPFVDGWVRRDRCAARAAVGMLAPDTSTYRWHGCAGGVIVEHIKIRGGRHQWPGANPPDPGPAATFCAACTVWRFFAGLQPGPRTWARPAAPNRPGRR